MTVEEIRGRIDALDVKLLELLNERAACALEIGKIKQSSNAAYYVPEREKEIFDRVRAANPGPLPDGAVKAIFREIISAMRALEKPVAVAYLGPQDTFSHLAAIRIFGSQADFHPMTTFDDIFTEVERKRVDYGVVPVETAMGGGISDTLDRFIRSDLKIVNELMLHVKQSLLSNCSLDQIEKVYSKEQVFVQCRSWLKANLTHAELIATPSTAEAARIAASEPHSAAIGVAAAADTYGIKALVTGIEDATHNYTRFFVVGRHLAKPTGHDKTSVLCSIKDRPGALYDLLKPFASSGVNMTRIESRPSRKKAWDYVFFIDLMGHAADPKVKSVLDEVSHYCNELKVLGSFPHGELEE